MTYFPILKAPGCTGWTTLSNFSPNNWEATKNCEKYAYVTWAENGSWHSEELGKLEENSFLRIDISDLNGVVPEDTLPLLSISNDRLPKENRALMQPSSLSTTMPAWRATLGLSTNNASVSYQGEVNPFPSPGSLLTFCPFLQFGNDIQNYLLLLNVENSPVRRSSKVEIYSSDSNQLRAEYTVNNNNINVIPMDDMGFSETDLPLILCREMSSIPLYYSSSCDGSFLSLEHTHPPASYVIHGKRFNIQRLLKQMWFEKLTS